MDKFVYIGLDDEHGNYIAINMVNYGRFVLESNIRQESLALRKAKWIQVLEKVSNGDLTIEDHPTIPLEGTTKHE